MFLDRGITRYILENFNNATIQQVDAFIDFLNPQWEQIFLSTTTDYALEFEKFARQYYDYEKDCHGDVKQIAHPSATCQLQESI